MNNVIEKAKKAISLYENLGWGTDSEKGLLKRLKDVVEYAESLEGSTECRLVSYEPSGKTCTLNLCGVEMYYSRTAINEND